MGKMTTSSPENPTYPSIGSSSQPTTFCPYNISKRGLEDAGQTNPLFSNHEASFTVSAGKLVTEKAATLSQDRERELNTASANHVATVLHKLL